MSTAYNEQVDDVNDFLMGGGIPSARFPVIGTKYAGVIDRKPEKQQQREYNTGKPLFWDNNGEPKWQIKIVLRTDERDPQVPDDEGLRVVYAKGDMLKGLTAAVRKAGARLAAGGYLEVIYTGDGEAKGLLNPPKLYSVTYQAPAVSAVDDIIDTRAPAAAAPAPAPAVAPAAVPAPAAPAVDLSKLSPEQIAALLKVQAAG